jgi:HAD superfamily hydrolase (TIGR01509 family)
MSRTDHKARAWRQAGNKLIPMTIDAIIFDCDGVLVDSEAVSQHLSWQWAANAGVPITEAELAERYRGTYDPEMARDLEVRYGVTLPENFSATLKVAKVEAFATQVTPMPGARTTVELVAASGLPFCIGTSGSSEETESKLTSAGLADLFRRDRIFTAPQVKRGKPFPDLFLLAASTLGVPPARCLVIEDSAAGVRAALAGAMQVIGYAPDGDVFGLAGLGAAVVGDLVDAVAFLRV